MTHLVLRETPDFHFKLLLPNESFIKSVRWQNNDNAKNTKLKHHLNTAPKNPKHIELEFNGRNGEPFMKYLKLIKRGVILCLTATFLPLAAWGAESLPHPDTYLPQPTEINKMKRLMDDNADLMVINPPKSLLPPEIYEQMIFDVDETKRQTAEIIGFKSPDVVGKIAPEIKPGKYTYKDVEQNPGLKELFPPELLIHIKPGGPPFAGSIPEFEIMPTRQLYWFLRLCEITKKNLGR